MEVAWFLFCCHVITIKTISMTAEQLNVPKDESRYGCWYYATPFQRHCPLFFHASAPYATSLYKPAMISLSLGSRLTVQGRNISTSLAVRTGVLEERKTSKLRMSPSISSSGSTSLVVGMLLEILQRKKGKETEVNVEIVLIFPY